MHSPSTPSSPPSHPSFPPPALFCRHDPRLLAACRLQARSDALAMGLSERQFCKENGVPRSTLRDQVLRCQTIDVDPDLLAFFESPTGQLFLLRLVVVLHFVLCFLCRQGVERVCQILTLLRLNVFVAASLGAHYSFHQTLRQAILAFGKQEVARLSQGMPPTWVWLLEDETFFSRMILVAIDAISGYILVEKYSEKRDQKAWDDAVKEGIHGMRVKVLGATSDDARGLQAHHKKGICVDSMPELFHLQHELVKTCSAPLAREVRLLDNAITEAKETDENLQCLLEMRKNAVDRCQRMAAVNQGIGEAYHPYDLVTGEKRTKEQVKKELDELLEEARLVAKEGSLPLRCEKAIEKVQRSVDKVGEAVERFHERNREEWKVRQFSLELQQTLEERILPACYLVQVAGRTEEGQVRRTLLQRAKTLILPLRENPTNFPERISLEELLNLGQLQAKLFQRSSSRVEGENGSLSDAEQTLRGQSQERVEVGRIVKNFWPRGEEKTTAAERFFKQAPMDLLEWLMVQAPKLPRPAVKRDPPPVHPLLN